MPIRSHKPKHFGSIPKPATLKLRFIRNSQFGGFMIKIYLFILFLFLVFWYCMMWRVNYLILKLKKDVDLLMENLHD